MSNYIDVNTLAEMDALLVSDLSISTASSLFPTNTRKAALNRAYRKAGGLFPWPALEDAKKTSTAINQEYYDAPQTWKPDSIWRVTIDDNVYGETPDGSPLTYNDYLDWRANAANANSTAKKWAVQWLRFFVYPVPTTVGSNNIVIWGQKNVGTLSSDSDTTIFSYSMPECNEAVVLEAKAILQNKGEAMNSAQFASAEAKGILGVAFNKIRQEQQKYEKNQPFFDVPDFYAGKSNRKDSNIGNFTIIQ